MLPKIKGGQKIMDCITREYTVLFNGITNAIAQTVELTRQLQQLQAAAEDCYISAPEEGQPVGQM